MVTKKSAPRKAPAATLATRAKKAAPKAATTESRKMQPHDLLLSPTCQNAIGMDAWGKFAGVTDLADMVKDLRERIDKVKAGDMSSVEAMLYGQAMTLQTMFTALARSAATETGLKQYQAKLTFALKAQAQCRSTLEALAEIKNPRTVSFVKQANVTTGHQQVNNTYAAASGHTGISSPAENFQSEPNKLLEADHGQRMVIGAQGQTGRANQAVEAVGQVHRAEVA